MQDPTALEIASSPAVELADTFKRHNAGTLGRIQEFSTEEQITFLESLGIDPRALALQVYDEAVTEESSDALIEWLKDQLELPLWLRWVPLWRILDGFVPEKLRGLLVRALYGSWYG